MTHETLSVIVWVVFFGVVFGAFYAYYQRRLLGNILRAFISCGAQDEKSAKTLREIGYASKIKYSFASFALRKGAGLRKHIYAVYEEKPVSKKHSDQLFAKAPKPENEQKYYVPEEKRIVAEVRYDGKGTNLKTLVISIAALLAAAILIVSFLPWIIEKYNSVFSSGSKDEKTDEDIYIEDQYESEEETDKTDPEPEPEPETDDGKDPLKTVRTEK
jgi:hypothetical protein